MRLRLFLSFALITIITLVVLAVVIQSNTQTTITSFAKSGGFLGADRIVTQLSAYYQENGSWDGITSQLTLYTEQNANGQPSENSQGQGMGMGQGRGGPRSGYMLMGGQGMLGEFTLTDADGHVLVSENTSLPEDLPKDVLKNALPISVEDHIVGYLVPDNNILDLSEIISDNLSLTLNKSMLVTVLISGGIALALAVVLAQFLIRPVRQLTHAAENLARGDLSQRVPEDGGAELEILATTFNRMAESLEKSHQVRKAMTADIAHELRNPLAVQKANLEAIQDGVYPLTLDTLQPIFQQNMLLNKLVEDLRTLALADTNSLALEKTAIDLIPFVQKICDNVQPQFDAKQLQLRFEPAVECPKIILDPVRINQVIYNLLQNSLRHTPAGGTVELSLACDAGNAIFQIRDTGEGIPEDLLPLVFERFFRADQSRARDKGGTGLGLTIARRLVEAHQGTLTAANHPDGGAVFTLTLPL